MLIVEVMPVLIGHKAYQFIIDQPLANFYCFFLWKKHQKPAFFLVEKASDSGPLQKSTQIYYLGALKM